MEVSQFCIIIFIILNFCQKYQKQSRDHHMLSQTFNFTLVNTQKLTQNYLSIRPNCLIVDLT